MKILLHICCAPCSIYPLKSLKKFSEICGFFYKHNIHPYSECIKRETALKKYANYLSLKVIYQKNYNLEDFLQKIAFREKNRCLLCYHDRIISTAKMAKKNNFDCFSTTLLYSKFQNHDLIKSLGESIARKIGISFYYDDFRTGWKEGFKESKKLGMYRQSYCGCVYSEKEIHFK